MHNKPLVSVIVPFLNAESFMEEAIQSVFAQTYTNWELLLVDDGSTDRSTDLARQYAAERQQQVRYLEHGDHTNRGSSASRNLGISHARGNYIAFLDADDVWFSHKLADQIAILISHPEIAMVYGVTQYWYSWTEDPDDLKRDYIQRHGVPANSAIKPPTLLMYFLQGRAAIPPPCSVLIRRATCDAVGNYEESFPGMYDDQAFYAKVCLREPVFLSNRCWDKYRQHQDSLCAVAARTRQVETKHLVYLRWLKTYLLEQGFADIEVWHSLEEELRYYEDASWLSMNKIRRYLGRRSRKFWSRITVKASN